MKNILLKPIPNFSSECQERNSWQTHDSTEYVDWSHAQRWQLPNLKLSSRPITIRLSNVLIDRLKVMAHRKDMPYQTMIKQILTEAVG